VNLRLVLMVIGEVAKHEQIVVIEPGALLHNRGVAACCIRPLALSDRNTFWSGDRQPAVRE